MTPRGLRIKNKKGMSLAEVMIALALLSFLILLVSGTVTSAYQTAASMQKLPSLYYGGQDLMESALDDLGQKLTQKYRLEKEIDNLLRPDPELRRQAEALEAELEKNCEKQSLRLFGKDVTLYQITTRLTKENGNSVTLIGGSAGGIRLERPVPVLDTVSVNPVGEAPSYDLFNAVGKTLSVEISYADINRDYVYSELCQWYVSVGDAHTVCFSDGTPGTDEALHGGLIPVFPGDFTLIPSGRSATLTVTDEWAGRFLCCQVTPLSINGKMGQSVTSTPVYISPLPGGYNYKAVIDASLVPLDSSAESPVRLTQIPGTGAASGSFSGVNGPEISFAGTPVSGEGTADSRFFSFTSASSVRSSCKADAGDVVLAVVRQKGPTPENFLTAGNGSFGFSGGASVIAEGSDGWALLEMTVTERADAYVLGNAEADIAELIIIGRPGPAGTGSLRSSLCGKYSLNTAGQALP